ncbi:hypothetical protein IWZ03DRAFT_443995 [Phyllosticta citriasiana]|uniref:Uncharacterized protein n=1 Tax=Phyllosticta citriasiana TaxID=595635 RepID=A0ABR1KHI0_9PEZI
MDAALAIRESDSAFLLSENPNTGSETEAVLNNSEPSERPEIPGWPEKPRKLRDTTTALPLQVLSQATVALIPTSFIVLGVFVSLMNGESVLNSNESVIQATRIASTLWPIAFAAVIGPMLKAVALYRAERGAKLGTIELFSQSQTLTSTLKGCYSLRLLSLWTFLLVGIWSLSPVGGQAVLRLLRPEGVPKMSTPTLFYYPHHELSMIWGNNGGSGASYNMVFWEMVYGAALSAANSAVLLANGSSPGFEDAVQRITPSEAINGTRQDMWGNVRIPLLHLLPGYNRSSPHQWVDVLLDEVVAFESLIGVPVRGISTSDAGNMTFNLSASYNVLDCSDFTNLTRWFQTNDTQFERHKTRNKTIYYENSSGRTAPNFFMDLLSVDAQEPYGPSKDILVFGGRSGDSNIRSYDEMTFCHVTLTYVDVYVECIRLFVRGQLSCAARKVRQKLDIPSGPETQEMSPFRTWSHNNLYELSFLLVGTHPSQSSPFERYLGDPTNLFPSKGDYDSYPIYSHISSPIFSARLTMLINTFWYITLNTTTFLGTNLGVPSPTDSKFSHWGTTTGNWTTPTPQTYSISKIWMSLYVIATAILSACALITIILQSRTRAPDILSSVSSLTRDSPYFVAVPRGGSGLEGSERARLLKDIWVRIQDVQPENQVGKIAFSDNQELVASLKWNRSYE